ncbi:MAG: hypothetical protein WD988_02755 [Candidatus Curtissbacteria bacterium]
MDKKTTVTKMDRFIVFASPFIFLVGLLNLLAVGSAVELMAGFIWMAIGGWAFVTRFKKIREDHSK